MPFSIKPFFFTDIDECTTGLHSCHSSRASCTNTVGSYSCSCDHPYTGDGRTCNLVAGNYWSRLHFPFFFLFFFFFFFFFFTSINQTEISRCKGAGRNQDRVIEWFSVRKRRSKVKICQMFKESWSSSSNFFDKKKDPFPPPHPFPSISTTRIGFEYVLFSY